MDPLTAASLLGFGRRLGRKAEPPSQPSPRAVEAPTNSQYRSTLDVEVYGAQGKRQRVRAKLDTGAATNFISNTIATRLGQGIAPPRDQDRYVGAGGPVHSLGEIYLRFHLVNGAKTFNVPFQVLEDPPFDMLLGERFIQEHGVYTYNEGVFPLYFAKPKTNGDEAFLDLQRQQSGERREREVAGRAKQRAEARERDRLASPYAQPDPYAQSGYTYGGSSSSGYGQTGRQGGERSWGGRQ